jgi:hypothetical protein
MVDERTVVLLGWRKTTTPSWMVLIREREQASQLFLSSILESLSRPSSVSRLFQALFLSPFSGSREQ